MTKMAMESSRAGNGDTRNRRLEIALSAMILLVSSPGFAQAPNPQRPAQPPAAVRPAAPAPAARAPTAPQAPPAAPAPTTALAPAVPSGEVIARVGSTDVTTDEVRSFMATLAPREQVAIARDPALLSQAVRIMLANQLVLKEALAKKWEQQPAVAAQLRQIQSNAITESYLQSVSTPPASFPDTADLEKAYDANKTSFVVPRQFQISQVFVALSKDADKAAEDKAKKKLAEIQGKLRQPGADFSAIARTESDDPETAARGGEIGLIPESQLRPEIKSQVMGMMPNAISEPIKLDDGWHIVKLLETKASYTRPLTEVRELLVQRLRAQQAEAMRRAYLAKVLEQTPPAINEIALSKMLGEGSSLLTR